MVEKKETAHDAQEPNTGQDNGPPRDLRGVFVAAGWAFIGLLLVARFWPNLPQRMAFFTGNLFNLLIAFAVIAQVIVYLKQSQIMERQLRATESAANTAKEALYIAERPYLDVADLNISPIPLIAHQPITYFAKIQNVGRTPAYDFEGMIYIDIRPDPLPEEPEYIPVDHVSKANLGPGRTHIYSRTTPDLDLAPSTIAAIERGDLRVYIYGTATYRDGFTPPSLHRLRYCQKFNPLTRRMEIMRYHNDST